MRTVKLIRGLLLTCSLLLVMPAAASQAGAQRGRPLSLPFATPPGPATWLVGQHYGNTSGAFNFGQYWYRAGQGLHFGTDFPTPCGTPVVALADGVVEHIDNFSFGSRPHNLVIAHPDLGYAVLYGHLLATPTLLRGQPVRRGDVVGQTGDPDVTCVSRPHLHLEVRSLDYRTAYNPAALIDADWAMLSSIGHFGIAGFVKDLYAPNRWQTVDSQPEVKFGGAQLNRFEDSWPVRTRFLPPAQTLPFYAAPPVPDAAFALDRLTPPGCCSWAWWSPDGRSVRFWDGLEGQRAAVYSVSLEGSRAGDPDPQGYSQYSPDGAYQVAWDNGRVTVTRLADGEAWPILTQGAWPRFSPYSKRLLWQVIPADNIPGEAPPLTEVWTANPDGSGRQRIVRQAGGSALWLDEERLLLTRREPNSLNIALVVHTLGTGEERILASQPFLRGMYIAPGGRHLIYYLAFQPDPAANGMYLLDTFGVGAPVKLPWFGSYRWRDGFSVVYVPFAPGSPTQFRLYNVVTGEDRALTNPQTQRFSIATDDWSVAPDGQTILFWSAEDAALWTIRMGGNG
jgi:hypothetical protein